MMTLLLGAALGLLGPPRSDAIPAIRYSCSYMGVFHLEVSGRYTLTLEEAKQACESLNTMLASQEEVSKAYSKGLETCRYGWISDGNATILRHNYHPNCANNQTGLIFTSDTNATYDTYCYNASDSSEKHCPKLISPVTSGPESPPGGRGESTITAAPTMQPDAAEDDLDEGATTVMVTTTSDLNSKEDNGMIPDPSTLGPEEWTPSPAQGKGSTEWLPLSTHVKDQKEESEGNVPSPTPSVDLFDDFTSSGSSQDTTEEDKPIGATTPAELDNAESATGNSKPERHSPEVNPEFEFVPSKDSNKRRKAVGLTPTDSTQESHDTPDWLIILTVVIVVAVILLVIAAVVTRNRWCGKQETLMITKESAEGNGAAAEEREQEMVTLMHKENIQENGNKEEFTCIALEETPEKGQLA